MLLCSSMISRTVKLPKLPSDSKTSQHQRKVWCLRPHFRVLTYYVIFSTVKIFESTMYYSSDEDKLVAARYDVQRALPPSSSRPNASKP